MSDLPYAYYIDIVTKRYFNAVDNYDLDGVLDCFHSDASLTEVTTMTSHSGRDKGIKTMFEGLFDSFSHIWHGNFVHTADAKTQSICSQFTVLITPHDGEELRYENCNRFYLRDGKFSEVFVYMSGDNLLV